MSNVRLLLISVLALLSCGGSPHARPSGGAQARHIAVQIKNGPILYGQLIRRDAKSISIKIGDEDCGVKIDLKDVARVFDMSRAEKGSGESPGARRMSREAWLSLGARARR